MTPFTASEITLAKIETFSHLQKGWCYGTGGPLPIATINNATAWLASLVQMGFLENDAFPGADGEILVSAYIGNSNIDITVYADGEASLVAETETREVLAIPKSPSAGVQEQIEVTLAIIWNLSDSFIPNTSINAKVALKAWHSKTLQIREERQFSNCSVASTPQATSAHISNGSTQTSGAIQRSFGSSKPTAFQLKAA